MQPGGASCLDQSGIDDVGIVDDQPVVGIVCIDDTQLVVVEYFGSDGAGTANVVVDIGDDVCARQNRKEIVDVVRHLNATAALERGVGYRDQFRLGGIPAEVDQAGIVDDAADLQGRAVEDRDGARIGASCRPFCRGEGTVVTDRQRGVSACGDAKHGMIRVAYDRVRACNR